MEQSKKLIGWYETKQVNDAINAKTTALGVDKSDVLRMLVRGKISLRIGADSKKVTLSSEKH